jgi:hypothetical protein
MAVKSRRVGEEHRDRAELTRGRLVGERLDAGGNLRREVAPESRAAPLLGDDAVDELDRPVDDEETRRRHPEHDEDEGDDERPVRIGLHEEDQLESGADDGGENDAAALEGEGGGDGKEREIRDGEHARDHVRPRRRGQLEGERHRHVEEGNVEPDEPGDPVRAAPGDVERRGGDPIDGEQRHAGLKLPRLGQDEPHGAVEGERDRDAGETHACEEPAAAQALGRERAAGDVVVEVERHALPAVRRPTGEGASRAAEQRRPALLPEGEEPPEV